MRPSRLIAAATLLLSFTLALVRANIAVAKLVLSPRLRIRPGIVRFPTVLRSDAAITLLANMITLTPGTLTVAVSENRDCIHVHALDIDEPGQVVADIRRDMERHIARLER